MSESTSSEQQGQLSPSAATIELSLTTTTTSTARRRYDVHARPPPSAPSTMNSANCPLTLASPTSPTRRTITPYPLVRPSGDQHQDGSGRGPSAGAKAGVGGGGARASTSALPSASASGSRSGSQARTSGTAADSSSPTRTQASRQSFQPSPDLSRSSSARSARLSSSLLPALRLAGLVADPDRDLPRRDMRSTRSSRDASQKQRPLVILKLSASSFLDTVIRDDKSKDPLYILETTGENTAIYRLDHPRDEPIKAATVQWPVQPVRVKGKSGRSIQFGGGSWRESEELLKAGPLGNTAYAIHFLPICHFRFPTSQQDTQVQHPPLSQQPEVEAHPWQLLLCTCASSRVI